MLDGAQNEIYTQRPTQSQNNIIENNLDQSAMIVDQAPRIRDTFSDIDQQEKNTKSNNLIFVKTDVLELQINPKGGTIQGAKLLKYPKTKDQPDLLVELLSSNGPDFGLIQSGLRSVNGEQEANHLVTYMTEALNYELTYDGELIIPLYWNDGNGVIVEKRFRLTNGSYNVHIEHRLQNNSSQQWQGTSYSQIIKRVNTKTRSMFDVESFSFDGPITYDGNKSEKIDASDLYEDGPLKYSSDEGWVGNIQHHFVSVVVPPIGEEQRYQISTDNVRVISSTIGSIQSINAGESKTFTTSTFIGPKLQSQMDEITPSLKLTVDYGFLTVLSDPLFWLLSFIYSFVNNWGFAIILVTVIIKLLFYKLTEKSGHSMAKMRAIAPRLKSIQERYKDNKAELGKATMELYKREKVNPAAGCVPMLIQMPFFLAFYWVLLESVEMRQAPFVLWLTDLSSRDPYFILPLIMAAAMLLQTKLNPAPADPMQAKVMQIMPLMFSVMFAFFPSGLVLYWVTNTVLSILQQWLINKKYGVNET
tara:strand:- start:1748 stop:3340 length:1593 start_codon:yes stop_codon:yes gene_type:complete